MFYGNGNLLSFITETHLSPDGNYSDRALNPSSCQHSLSIKLELLLRAAGPKRNIGSSRDSLLILGRLLSMFQQNAQVGDQALCSETDKNKLLKHEGCWMNGDKDRGERRNQMGSEKTKTIFTGKPKKNFTVSLFK